MKYKFSYDKINKIVKVEFYHYLEDADVGTFYKDMLATIKGKDIIGAILDHSPLLDKGIPNLSRKGRKEFGDVAKNSGIRKFAMVSVPAMVKTISQTIGFLASNEKQETKFFKSEEEAIRWIKE